MKKTYSRLAVAGGVLVVLSVLVQSSASANAADAVPLSMRETSKACIPQEELRKIAEHTCELLDAVITNVKFEDLCGAKGRAPMYSTIVYDCHPSRALH